MEEDSRFTKNKVTVMRTIHVMLKPVYYTSHTLYSLCIYIFNTSMHITCLHTSYNIHTYFRYIPSMSQHLTKRK